LLTGCGGVTNRNGVIICEDLLIAKEEIVFKSKVKNKHKGDGNIEKLKVLSLFSGIGAFEGGLERLGIDFELVGISEIDVHALVAYAAIHCNLLNYEHLFDLEDDIDNKREYIKPLGLIKSNKPINVDKLKARELNSIYYACKLTSNLGDISEVESLLDYKDKADLIVGGSPCQDFSIAGKQQGSIFKCLDCESEFNPLVIHHTKRDFCPKCNSINLEKTRSSLLIEYLRTIREVRPKYFIYENVKNIVGKKFKKAFDMFNDELQEYGYNTYYQILNAKDYGIPQNRERVFVIGIREDADNGDFKFPEPFDSGLRLKDLLQDEVEEKYYINNERVDELLSRLKDGKLGHYPNVGAEPLSSSALSSREHRALGWSENIGTLCARDYKDPKVIAEPAVVAERGRYREDGKIEQQLEVQESGNSNALTTVQKDNLVLEQTVCEQRTDEGLRFFKDNVVGTIRTIDSGGDKRVIEKTDELLVVGNTVPSEHTAGRVFNVDGISPTVMYRNAKVVQILEESANELQLFTNLSGGKWDKIHESARRVYDETGISPTIPTCGGGNIEPKVAVREATKKGYDIATVGDSINVAFPNSTTRRGRVGKEVAQTLETGCNQATLENDYKIRKLTPLECWRLLNFNDEDYWNARKALESTYYNGGDRSNSQMYKMAGNSIVVNVLVEIYKNLLEEYIIE